MNNAGVRGLFQPRHRRDPVCTCGLLRRSTFSV